MTDAPTRATGTGRADIAGLRRRIGARLVGRERDLELVLAAVGSGRDLVIEGPPGTSKTTMLQAVTAEWDIPLVFVEGNADLTPSRLVGHHNPAMVLRQDYGPATWVDGPLVDAMRRGGFLYIEEFNRAPEDTLNTLLTAIADRRISIPNVGVVAALPTFRVVASMNPYDNVGTTRLSTSVSDRLNRIVVGYQGEEEERGIVALRTGLTGATGDRVVADAVAVTRATRDHEAVRQGSSVRGAIDTALVVSELLMLRGVPDAADERYPETMYDAMLVGLSGRVHLDEAAETTPERVLREIWEDRFVLDPARAEPG